jgi:hypothetical protein
MFNVFAMAGLYIIGVLWCYEIVRRFREDVKEIREVKEFTRKAAIIFIWALTVIIAIVLIKYTRVMIKEFFLFFNIFS